MKNKTIHLNKIRTKQQLEEIGERFVKRSHWAKSAYENTNLNKKQRIRALNIWTTYNIRLSNLIFVIMKLIKYNLDEQAKSLESGGIIAEVKSGEVIINKRFNIK